MEDPQVSIAMSKTDALLLQGLLRRDRRHFEAHRNEVMTGMLDRLEVVLDLAQKGNELDKMESVLGM